MDDSKEAYDLKNLNESQVIAASEFLERYGFEYDHDYTTLYASKWALCGLRFMTEAAYWLAVWFIPNQQLLSPIYKQL